MPAEETFVGEGFGIFSDSVEHHFYDAVDIVGRCYIIYCADAHFFCHGGADFVGAEEDIFNLRGGYNIVGKCLNYSMLLSVEAD